MADLNYYLQVGISSNVGQQLVASSPGSDATTSPAVGWNVGTAGAGNYASLDAQTTVPSGSFSTTPQPDGSLVTTQAAGDFMRSPVPLKGAIASATVTFHGVVIQTGSGVGAKGKIRVRLFRHSSIDGSSATEVTSAAQVGNEVTLSSITQADSQVSFAIADFNPNNEHLSFQIGWEITQAASGMGATGCNVILRYGATGTRVTITGFTQDSAQTAHSETGSPTSVAESGSDIPWTGPAFGAVTDGNVAQFITTPFLTDQNSERLQGLAPPSFQDIPDTATVDKIVFRSDLNCDNADAIKFTEVYLLVAGSISGNNKATFSYFPTTLGIFEWEWSVGSGDTLPTVAQLKASNFGLSLQAKNELGNGEIGRIDQMEGYVLFSGGLVVPLRMLMGVGP